MVEFNESFSQALERQKRVRWPYFEGLRWALAKGNLRHELVALPGGDLSAGTFSPTISGTKGGIGNSDNPCTPPHDAAAIQETVDSVTKPLDGPTTAGQARVLDPPRN